MTARETDCEPTLRQTEERRAAVLAASGAFEGRGAPVARSESPQSSDDRRKAWVAVAAGAAVLAVGAALLLGGGDGLDAGRDGAGGQGGDRAHVPVPGTPSTPPPSMPSQPARNAEEELQLAQDYLLRMRVDERYAPMALEACRRASEQSGTAGNPDAFERRARDVCDEAQAFIDERLDLLERDYQVLSRRGQRREARALVARMRSLADGADADRLERIENYSKY